MPGRTTKKEFSFYMTTDGVGASFVCKKPKGDQAGEELTPENVPFVKGQTVFRAIDPGLTDLVTGITPDLLWSEDDAMPEFGDDRGAGFKISTAEWHHMAGHIAARRHHERLICVAKARGIDIRALEADIPSGKTSSAKAFLKHANEGG